MSHFVGAAVGLHRLTSFFGGMCEMNRFSVVPCRSYKQQKTRQIDKELFAKRCASRNYSGGGTWQY